MLEVKDLSFEYHLDGRSVNVLNHLNFTVNRGEFVAIQGPSGSGKSTLFYILGFLLKPTSGNVNFEGFEIANLSSDELTILRNRKIGFVFQQFHLLSKTDVLQNILLPTQYPSEAPSPQNDARKRVLHFAELLGLKDHLGHLPNQLSGGQQQRVAIARALMNDVDLILADEPTGNLDSRNAKQILELLTEFNRQGKTIILITHDSEVAKYCSKVYHLKDGFLTKTEENYPYRPAEEKAGQKKPVLLPKKLPFELYRKIVHATFPIALQNLLRNKAKSILTMLGVIIGVAAVMAMVTLGQFTRQKILESYESLGVNKLLIRGYPNWNLKATDEVPVNFTGFDWDKDLLVLRKLFPEIRYLSPVLNDWQQTVTAGGRVVTDKVTIFGVTPEYMKITSRKIEYGRNINPYHVEKRSPVCLIGYEIAKRLFLRINPLGQIMTVTDGRTNSYPCQVIGVFASQTSNKDWAPPNLQVVMPYTYFRTVTNRWNSRIFESALQMASESDVESTGLKVRSYFEQKYGKSGQFFVDTDSTLVAQMKRFLNLFTILLTAIALLSLLVGGIGINNMMLVSVSERIKEFGIRKALGATDRTIRTQVLLESLVLCSAAGLLGALFGFTTYELLIYGATHFVPNLKFEWVFDGVAVSLSLISIVTVGIASGFIPALRAEKLQVIEALRTE